MTGYNDSTAYAFDLFETHERTPSPRAQSARSSSARSSAAYAAAHVSAAAPGRAAEPKKHTAPIKKVASKSKKQVKVETRQNAVGCFFCIESSNQCAYPAV